MNLTIEKFDKKGVSTIETIELAYKRCTGAVEDRFFKALSKMTNGNLQMKMFSVLAKYIDEAAENQEQEYQNALTKAVKNNELTIDEITEITSKTVNYEEKLANRTAKIEALQACAFTDSKYMKDFESKPDSEFWQSITSDDIDAAVGFFRTQNRI